MNIQEELKSLVEEAFDPLMALASKEANANKLYVNLLGLLQMVANDVDNCKADADRYNSIKDEYYAMQDFFLKAKGYEMNDIYAERGREATIRVEGPVDFEHVDFMKKLLEQKFTSYSKLPDVRY